MRLAGARCLVTGATGGIGSAVARELAARQADLIVTGRSPEQLSALASSVTARTIERDLTEPGAVVVLAEEAGPVDVVVHSAGLGLYGAVAGLDTGRLEQLVRLNVTVPLTLTAALLPGMLERKRGCVVLVGSIAGRVGRGREAAYAATKGAVSLFADSLRSELLGTGVGVVLVTPGPVATGFFERRGVPYDRTWPRPVRPGRVAAAIVSAIEADRAEVTIPRWLGLPVRLRGAAPALYRALAGRFD